MEHRVFKTPFSKIYSLLVEKAVRKGRTKNEVDTVIYWLTGYDETGLMAQIEKNVDYETFFNEAPRMNPDAEKITGVICGYRVENIEDPLMKKIRWLDKLVDELAKGKPMEKIWVNHFFYVIVRYVSLSSHRIKRHGRCRFGNLPCG